METLNIHPTEVTPKIIFDAGNNIFEMSGRSLPEDAMGFYQPVLEWLDKYAESPNSETKFECKLEYFNTASSKIMLNILSKLEDIKEDASNVTVHWYYHLADPDMEEAGEEYADLLNLNFEIKEYTE